jgi:hypothetical protein
MSENVATHNELLEIIDVVEALNRVDAEIELINLEVYITITDLNGEVLGTIKGDPTGSIGFGTQ